MKFIRLLFPAIIAIFLIISDYKFSYLDRVRSAVNYAISPIYALVNIPSQLYIWINEQGRTKDKLLSQNKHLNAENFKLKAKLQELDSLRLENKKLKNLLNSKYSISNKEFKLSRVVSINKSRLKKQLVVNKGSDDGIRLGQVALAANGVVGQVTLVSDSFATISIITDPTQYVPVKNARNGIRGVTKGFALNKELLKVEFIENISDIKIGDMFLTSGMGDKFPSGYPVGKVSNIKQNKNDSFLYIELDPIQDTQDLEFVIITTD